MSVIVATYEGARFVAEQIRSIVGQTRPPDEVLICDDASTDNTLQIVHACVASATTSIPITIDANQTRLGVSRNFEQLITRATGDVIVFADQDDIWTPSRLAAIEPLFEPGEVGAVFSNARVIDRDGRLIRESLWEVAGFDHRLRRVWARDPFAALVRRSVVTGATLAFRASHRGLVLPLDRHGWHDHWIALLIASRARVIALDEPLVDYRLHEGNQAGLASGKRSSGRIARRDWHRQRNQLLAARERLGRRGISEWHEMEIASKIRHLEFRLALPAARASRTWAIARHLSSGSYHRYATGMRSAVADLLSKDRVALSSSTPATDHAPKRAPEDPQV